MLRKPLFWRSRKKIPGYAALSRTQLAIRTTYFSIAGNVLLALIKGGAGYYGHSFALIADAIESTVDILASVLVLLGIWYAARPADENHPFGHGRMESLVTFLVVGFLIVSATFIATESIRNIRTPHELPRPFTLWVLAAIIVWKEASFQWVMRRARITHSSALRADAWHHRADALTSIAALVGILIALWLGPGYEAADDWAALLASGLILYNAYQIFRPALSEIMDEHTHDDVVKQIRTLAASVSGVVGTEKCFVRKVGMQYQVDLHALVPGDISVREGHNVAHDLEQILLQQMPELGRVIIHIEPDDYHPEWVDGLA